MRPAPLGDLQLEILRYLTDHGPLSVGEMAVRFGEPRRLARTTILTVMEKLREKGYLTRLKQGSVYRYSARVEKGEMLRGLIRDFVDRALGGSPSPFIAYLVQEKDLSDDEITALRRLLDEVEASRQEPGDASDGGRSRDR